MRDSFRSSVVCLLAIACLLVPVAVCAADSSATTTADPTNAATSAATTNSGANVGAGAVINPTLVDLLVKKGILTKSEANSLGNVSGSAGMQQLLLLLKAKGVVNDSEAAELKSAADAETLHSLVDAESGPTQTASLTTPGSGQAAAPKEAAAPVVIPAIAPVRVLPLDPPVKEGLAPALKNKLIDASSIIADSASGASGAGREPQTGSLFCEVDGGFKAYKVGKHRHTPEIEQELNILAGEKFAISFTPHLLPVKRGILSTIYTTLKEDITLPQLHSLYSSFYAGEKFVRLCPAGSFPDISFVCGSNFCDIGLAVDPRTKRVIIISAIDNLIKGAAGQAVQNMNIICGWKEDMGLQMAPLYP